MLEFKRVAIEECLKENEVWTVVKIKSNHLASKIPNRVIESKTHIIIFLIKLAKWKFHRSVKISNEDINHRGVYAIQLATLVSQYQV